MFSGVQEAGIEFHATVSGFENYLRIQALWGCLVVFRQESGVVGALHDSAVLFLFEAF